jgi:CRP-like cAMP-binding protein
VKTLAEIPEKINGSFQPAFEKLFAYLNEFSGLRYEDFEQIIPLLEVRKFDKKVQIVKQGEVENYLSIIVKGLVRKCLFVRKKEITIQLGTEGHIIQSEISFHRQEPSFATIETIEPSILISISYANLEKVFEKFPETERIARFVMTDMFIKKDMRYFLQLQKNTRERFLDYVEHHPHMLQRVPQKYLASYLNIKPETFSRLKHLLRTKKPVTG